MECPPLARNRRPPRRQPAGGDPSRCVLRGRQLRPPDSDARRRGNPNPRSPSPRRKNANLDVFGNPKGLADLAREHQHCGSPPCRPIHRCSRRPLPPRGIATRESRCRVHATARLLCGMSRKADDFAEKLCFHALRQQNGLIQTASAPADVGKRLTSWKIICHARHGGANSSSAGWPREPKGSVHGPKRKIPAPLILQ